MKPLFLDQSGKPSEKLTIRKDRPIPEGKFADNTVLGTLRSAIRALKPGESFDTVQNSYQVHRAATQANIKIVTRKLNGSGYAVWRK